MMAKGRARRRGRPAGKPLSRREVRARRSNLRQARRAPRELIYRPTEKRLAASLKNLRRAIAARRAEEGSERVRLNALKHGVYSRELLDESVERLGESERDLERHRELFRRLLVPRNENEAAVVWELANLAWRRLRLFRAQALREARDLHHLLQSYPPPSPLNAPQTLNRMYIILATLEDCDRVLQDASKLRVEMQGLIRLLASGREPAPVEQTKVPPPAEQGLLEDMELGISYDDLPPDDALPPDDDPGNL